MNRRNIVIKERFEGQERRGEERSTDESARLSERGLRGERGEDEDNSRSFSSNSKKGRGSRLQDDVICDAPTCR